MCHLGHSSSSRERFVESMEKITGFGVNVDCAVSGLSIELCKDPFQELKQEDRKLNKVILMGRLVRDPEVRYTQAENPMAVSRYTLAIDRRGIKIK